MADALRLWARYAGISMRGQMQYRASFLLAAGGQFLATAVEFIGMWALFDRFGQLKSWTFPEAALFYGVVHLSWALADALTTGFDRFGILVKQGDFDRLLLRPRSTVLQLAGHELALRRVGRLVQGAAVLVWASLALGLAWTPAKLGLLAAAVAGGTSLFFGIMILHATLAFWSTESLEIINTLTYGGIQSAQYPLSIYRAWFRHFFTFAVPLACVSYFPVVAILGRPDPLGTPPWLQGLAPVAGPAFLAAALQVWRVGVRRYTSTGS